jgi:hypothetical protein
MGTIVEHKRRPRSGKALDGALLEAALQGTCSFLYEPDGSLAAVVQREGSNVTVWQPEGAQPVKLPTLADVGGAA